MHITSSTCVAALSRRGDGLDDNPGDPEKRQRRALSGNKFLRSTESLPGRMCLKILERAIRTFRKYPTGVAGE
jgi:hypothetical protein